MSRKRIFKYCCLGLSFVCAMFLCVNVVFAAVQQAATCSVTVNYAPEIKAKVEVSVDGGTNFQTIFDNSTATSTNYSTSFEATSSSPIVFQVTNYTEGKDIKALVRFAPTIDTETGKAIPSNVFLCDGNNEEIDDNSLNIPANSTSIEKDDSSQSGIFYIQTLFSETVPFIVELATVNQSQGT